jgi:hypothetical protein
MSKGLNLVAEADNDDDLMTMLYTVKLKSVVPRCIVSRTQNSSSVNHEQILPMNGVFWYVTPCGSCKNRRFRGTYFFAAFVGC